MPNQKLTIELPSEMCSKLLTQCALLQKTPSLLIARALKHDLGLVGMTLTDDEVFGEEISERKTNEIHSL